MSNVGVVQYFALCEVVQETDVVSTFDGEQQRHATGFDEEVNAKTKHDARIIIVDVGLGDRGFDSIGEVVGMVTDFSPIGHAKFRYYHDIGGYTAVVETEIVDDG